MTAMQRNKGARVAINYTWPGRFHWIWKDGLFYITLWLFGRRLHWCNRGAA